MSAWSVHGEYVADEPTDEQVTKLFAVLHDYGVSIGGGRAGVSVTVTVEAPNAVKAAEAGHTVIVGGLLKAGVDHRQEVRLEVLDDDVLEAEIAVTPDHIYGERRARLSDELYSARALLPDDPVLSQVTRHLDAALRLVVPPEG